MSLSLRLAIKTRDNNKCRLKKACVGKGLKLQIHHLDNNPSNNQIDNLILVCLKCHGYLHKKQGVKRNPVIEKGKYRICKKCSGHFLIDRYCGKYFCSRVCSSEYRARNKIENKNLRMRRYKDKLKEKMDTDISFKEMRQEKAKLYNLKIKNKKLNDPSFAEQKRKENRKRVQVFREKNRGHKTIPSKDLFEHRRKLFFPQMGISNQ